MKLRPQVLPWCNKLLSNSDLKQPFCPTGSVGWRFRTDTEEILVSVLLRVAQRMRGPVAMAGAIGRCLHACIWRQVPPSVAASFGSDSGNSCMGLSV